MVKGPASLRDKYEGEGCTEAAYDLWLESWILHELDDLIPELRKEKQRKENVEST